MEQSRLAVDQEVVEGVPVVRLGGELDTFGASTVRDRLASLYESDRVVVDLSGLTFLDSAGLHVLFSIGRDAHESAAVLVFVVPDASPVRRVLELVQLADVSPVCESVESALEHAG